MDRNTGMLAFTIAGLCSQPAFAAGGAREELTRRCPGFQKQWETALAPNRPSGDSVRRTPDGFEVGQGDDLGEQFLRVELPSCASLGYAWWAEYVGGTHIPDAVHPML